MNSSQADQPDLAAASSCTASPRYPALVHKTCTDLQIDENHFRRSPNSVLVPTKRHALFFPSLCSNLALLARFDVSIPKEITRPVFLTLRLFRRPKHTTADYCPPRKFVRISNRGRSCSRLRLSPFHHPARSAPACRRAQTSLHCISRPFFPPRTSRLVADLLPGTHESIPSPKRTRISCHRFENHLISS